MNKIEQISFNHDIAIFFLETCVNIIRNNKVEFDEYKHAKLQAVKKLKEISGGGLKECKQVCDLYYDGILPLTLTNYDRKTKLEQLAKLPLIEEIFDKVSKMSKEDYISALKKLTLDDLLSIDEALTKND